MVEGRKSDSRGKRLAFAGHQLQPFAKLVVGRHDLVELGPADQAVPLPIEEAVAHELCGLQEVLPRGRRMAGRAFLAGRGQVLTANSTDETGGRGRHATLSSRSLLPRGTNVARTRQESKFVAKLRAIVPPGRRDLLAVRSSGFSRSQRNRFRLRRPWVHGAGRDYKRSLPQEEPTRHSLDFLGDRLL